MIPGRPRATARVVARPRYVGVSPVFSTDPASVLAIPVGPGFVKRVHFGISWAASVNRTLDAVTFNGSPCSRQARGVGAAASSNIEWYSIETAAESGDLGMDWSGGIVGGIAAIFWSPRSGALTNNDGAFTDSGSGTTLSATVNTYAGGYMLAGARYGSAVSATWTGADEVYDVGNAESFALLPVTVAETARPISVTLSASAAFRRLSALAVQ